MKTKKKARIEIRLSMEESDFARSLAKEAGITISDFFRDGAMKGRIIFTKTQSQEAVRNIIGSLSDLVFQMQMAGNNLNQLARSMNTDDQNKNTPDYHQINDHMLNIDVSITQTTDMSIKLIDTLQDIDIADMLFKTEVIEYDAKDKTYVKTYDELERIRSVIAENTLSQEEDQKHVVDHDVIQSGDTDKKEQEPRKEKPDTSWIDNFEMPDWCK